jgi:hypothetical protein
MNLARIGQGSDGGGVHMGVGGDEFFVGIHGGSSIQAGWGRSLKLLERARECNPRAGKGKMDERALVDSG